LPNVTSQLMDKYLSDGELSARFTQRHQDGHRLRFLDPTDVRVGHQTYRSQLLDKLILNHLSLTVDRGSIFGQKCLALRTLSKDSLMSRRFFGRVFKTIADPYAGRLTLFRVYSGSLNPDTSVF